MFEYRPGLYYEPFPRRLRLPRPTLPLQYVFIRIRSTHLRWCAGVWMTTLWSTYLGFWALNSRMNSITPCVAVCCSVLQCVAVCCSVLQRGIVLCRAKGLVSASKSMGWCSALQCVVVRCSESQYVAMCCSVLQCGAVQKALCLHSIPCGFSQSVMLHHQYVQGAS